MTLSWPEQAAGLAIVREVHKSKRWRHAGSRRTVCVAWSQHFQGPATRAEIVQAGLLCGARAVFSRHQYAESLVLEKLENFRMGAFGQMPNRDRACSQLAAEASSQTARSKTRQTEVVMPKWEEADVFAEPGLELQQLAQKRRQHMEKHCGILSEDYQRLAGLDTELYRVVANLRHAFAREQEALADRRHSAGPELCRSRTDFTKGSN
eukprot:g23696.t1